MDDQCDPQKPRAKDVRYIEGEALLDSPPCRGYKGIKSHACGAAWPSHEQAGRGSLGVARGSQLSAQATPKGRKGVVMKAPRAKQQETEAVWPSSSGSLDLL